MDATLSNRITAKDINLTSSISEWFEEFNYQHETIAPNQKELCSLLGLDDVDYYYSVYVTYSLRTEIFIYKGVFYNLKTGVKKITDVDPMKKLTDKKIKKLIKKDLTNVSYH